MSHRALLAFLATAVVVSACDRPRFIGPMVQGLPDGFLRQPEAAQDHEVFPGRPILMQDAYTRFGTDFSGIYIRMHEGPSTRRDIEAAVAASTAVEASRGVTYGAIEDLTVDGQPAWGWLEEERDQRGLQYVEYRAVISYDTVTYTVEFTSGDPAWKIKPDSIRAVVLSWADGEIEWNLGLIGLLAVAGVIALRSLRKKTARRQPIYQLVTIPTAEEEEEGAEEEHGGEEAAGEPAARSESERESGEGPQT